MKEALTWLKGVDQEVEEGEPRNMWKEQEVVPLIKHVEGKTRIGVEGARPGVPRP